jgi:hypothetical protein
MKISCYQCNTVTALEINFVAINFVCPICQSLYSLNSNKEFRLQRSFRHKIAHVGLQIGQKGILNDEEYTVTGIIKKKVYGAYYWNEYILNDKSNNFVYLSECDGHWIFLKDIADKFDVSNHPRFLTYNGIQMNLYDYTDVEIVAAQGFFDFVISTKKTHTTEYINAPYMISIEGNEEVQAVFFGEHISVKEIRKAFPFFTLPPKTGIGIVQPFFMNVRNTAIIFCFVSALVVISNWLIYSDKEEKNVLYKNLTFEEFNNKEFVTPSFRLEGGSAPMSISLSSGVDNSWANVEVALVNEKTNDEVYANKDIEYYHGYEDGESWTEGNPSEEFNICGVSAGKYHLVITPQKAPEDSQNNYLTINAVWNQPSSWNIWVAIIFMGVMLIILYYLDLNFERTRWEDSSYSPYEK